MDLLSLKIFCRKYSLHYRCQVAAAYINQCQWSDSRNTEANNYGNQNYTALEDQFSSLPLSVELYKQNAHRLTNKTVQNS
jgi:hypothetical protein